MSETLVARDDRAEVVVTSRGPAVSPPHWTPEATVGAMRALTLGGNSHASVWRDDTETAGRTITGNPSGPARGAGESMEVVGDPRRHRAELPVGAETDHNAGSMNAGREILVPTPLDTYAPRGTE